MRDDASHIYGIEARDKLVQQSTAIAAIKAGSLLATASFDAMKMACLAAEAAVRHLRGERVPREIILPV